MLGDNNSSKRVRDEDGAEDELLLDDAPFDEYGDYLDEGDEDEVDESFDLDEGARQLPNALYFPTSLEDEEDEEGKGVGID